MYSLASRKTLHERARRQKRRHLAELLLTIGIVALWWVTLAPQTIGGPLTYAVVSGTSMEPDFYSGDLIVAKEQAEYEVGDSVVYTIYGGYIVHQIISESDEGFETQGVNNDTPDSWIVPRENVLGKFLIAVPSLGNSLVFLRTHPLALGGFVAALAALLLIEFRPRRLSKRLTSLLETAKLEQPPKTWAAGTWLSSTLFMLALGSLVATSIMLTNGVDFFPRVALTLVAAVIATIGFEVVGFWVNSGQNLEEPYRSIRTFGSRLYLVKQEVDIPGQSQLVDTSAHLHHMAEIANSPVIHIVRGNGHLHEFWLITDDLNYFWRVEA